MDSKGRQGGIATGKTVQVNLLFVLLENSREGDRDVPRLECNNNNFDGLREADTNRLPKFGVTASSASARVGTSNNFGIDIVGKATKEISDDGKAESTGTGSSSEFIVLFMTGTSVNVNVSPSVAAPAPGAASAAGAKIVPGSFCVAVFQIACNESRAFLLVRMSQTKVFFKLW